MRPDLAACYGQERLPRYTSYPTAPHFSAAIGPDTYAEWLRAIPPDASASLYLHVPFCRAMCWYCGCHTTVARRDEPDRGLRFGAALRDRAGRASRSTAASGRAISISAAARRPSWRRRLCRPDRLDPACPSSCAPEAEIAVEIDPRTLTRQDDRRARRSAASTAPASACRASIRWFSAPSTACRASSRRRPRRAACGRRASPASTST